MQKNKINESIDLNFGGGVEELIEYECPCKQGRIIETHSTIPGEYEHDVVLLCEHCQKHYTLDTSKGVRNWELLPKQ